MESLQPPKQQTPSLPCSGKIKQGSNNLVPNADFKPTLAQLEQRSRYGDVTAKYQLAVRLVENQSDLPRATLLFAEAADKPVEGALTELIKLLTNPDVQHNLSPSRVEDYLKEAAAAGDKTAAEALGDKCLQEDKVVGVSFTSWPLIQFSSSQAPYYYSIASDNGILDCPAKFKLLKINADQGDRNAAYEIGLAYHHGHASWRVDKDHQLSAKYLKQAADAKHPEAAFLYAEEYFDDDNKTEEMWFRLEKSREYYQIAADHNNELAQLNVDASSLRATAIPPAKKLIERYKEELANARDPDKVAFFQKKLLKWNTFLLKRLITFANGRSSVSEAIDAAKQLIEKYKKDAELLASLEIPNQLDTYEKKLDSLNKIFKEMVEQQKPHLFVTNSFTTNSESERVKK